CPLAVFEHEDEGPKGGDSLQEPLPGRESLLLLGGSLFLRAAKTHQRSQPGPQPLALFRFLQEGGARRCERLVRERRVVGLEDAAVGLDDLPEGPERDSLAIRQTTTLPPIDQVGLLSDEPKELGQQTRLADTRLARDRDQLDRRIADRSGEGLP